MYERDDQNRYLIMSAMMQEIASSSSLQEDIAVDGFQGIDEMTQAQFDQAYMRYVYGAPQQTPDEADGKWMADRHPVPKIRQGALALRVERLEAALAWYADLAHWTRLPAQTPDHGGYVPVYRPGDVCFDRGQQARDTLEGKQTQDAGGPDVSPS